MNLFKGLFMKVEELVLSDFMIAGDIYGERPSMMQLPPF